MTSAHHTAQSSKYSQPLGPAEFRLPSIRDLNFYRPPPSQHDSPSSLPSDPAPVEQDHGARHGPAAWSRTGTTTSLSAPMPPQHMHSQSLSAAHEHPPPKPVEYASKHDSGGYLTPGMPLSAQLAPAPGSVSIGPGSRGDETSHSQNSVKRSRTGSSMNVPRDGRPSHAAYPHPQYAAYPPSQPPPPPTGSYQQVPSGPSAQEPVHHSPSGPHPGYGNYQQQQHQYMPPRPHSVQQPPPQQQHQGHTTQYPPVPPPQDPWEHHQQPHHQHHPHHQPQVSQPPPPPPPPPPQQQHQQQQQMAFSRPAPLVPTAVDSRHTPFAPADVDKGSMRESALSEILRHCSILYQFASRYAQLQASLPHVQPNAAELAEMTERASQVVRLLEDLRRMTITEGGRPHENVSSLAAPEDHRPPKRPWEDMSQDALPDSEPFPEQYPSSAEKPQSTAEQDMEIIRTKRATSSATGTATAGQPKSKYRKRSRATPPGKCHSCNIRETPEWRRGPDGARTLCNACGLHYAKLMRKRDKAMGPDGQAPRIDMETLRASARAADLASEKSQSRTRQSQSSQMRQSNESTSPDDSGKQPPHTHHQGSFQLVPMMTSGPNGSSTHPEGSHIMPPANDAPMPVPPPPWATSTHSAGHGRGGYAPDQLQHQSFMRSSQHVTSGPSPP